MFEDSEDQLVLECVPNFSEGQNPRVINRIADAMACVPGVRLLHRDSGFSAHRTVLTLIGPKDALVLAAFRGIETASQTIDMRWHQGVHARMGAADVVPFIPLAGSSMADAISAARELARRVGQDLDLPVYLYGQAATKDGGRELSAVRAGEYEGLAARLERGEDLPDFGPNTLRPKFGATAIGARDILIAYNVNLNTRSKKLAQLIAAKIREHGRPLKDKDGKILRDEHRRPQYELGRLPGVRALGWFIDEFGRAQVSCNLVDYRRNGLYEVFEACREEAEALGVRVTGSELIGLLPEEALLAAGERYLRDQGLCAAAPKARVLETAVQSLGLGELQPFCLKERILDDHLVAPLALAERPLRAFLADLSSEDPTPGGGAAAALIAALGAALVAMVGNLSYARGGKVSDRPANEAIAKAAQKLLKVFVQGMADDMAAFEGYLAANRPSVGPESKRAAIQRAAEVPLGLLERCLEVLDLSREVQKVANPHAQSDAVSAMHCARAAGECAALNVLANLESLEAVDEGTAADFRQRMDAALAKLRAV